MPEQEDIGGWASGASGTDDSLVRRLPADHVVQRYPGGTAPVPVPGTDEWYADNRVPVAHGVSLGGAVQVERVLAQPDVPAVREAILAYGPAGVYQYDIGLTAASPWGDSDTFHVIKIWYREEPDGRLCTYSARVAGEPVPTAVAVTVRGILIHLMRIKAIQEERGTYRTRTLD